MKLKMKITKPRTYSDVIDYIYDQTIVIVVVQECLVVGGCVALKQCRFEQVEARVDVGGFFHVGVQHVDQLRGDVCG